MSATAATRSDYAPPLTEGPASISIEVFPGASVRAGLGLDGVAEVERLASRDMQELTADLGLPGPRVTLQGDGARGGDVEVSVNGRPCRIPHRRTPVAHDPSSVAARIAEIAHENRELLASSEIADAMRDGGISEYVGPYGPGLPRGKFHEYLTLLVRHCFRCDRQYTPTSDDGIALPHFTAQACFEEAVRAISGLRLRVHLPPGDPGVDSLDEAPLQQQLADLQESVFYALGIRIPRVELVSDGWMPPDHFRIQVNDLRLPRLRGLSPAEFLVNDGAERLGQLKLTARDAVVPWTQSPAAIVAGDAEARAIARTAGLTTWTRGAYIVHACDAAVRRHAAAYVTAETVEYELSRLPLFERDAWKPYEPLVRWALERFGVHHIAQVLRGLVEEGISMRNLAGVLEAMLSVRYSTAADLSRFIVFFPTARPSAFAHASLGGEHGAGIEPAAHVECVRAALRAQISHQYSRGANTLVVYLLSPSIEEKAASSRGTPAEGEVRDEILRSVIDEVGDQPVPPQPIVLTTLEARRAFRDLVSVELPHLAVLSYQELSMDLNIQPVGRIY